MPSSHQPRSSRICRTADYHGTRAREESVEEVAQRAADHEASRRSTRQTRSARGRSGRPSSSVNRSSTRPRKAAATNSARRELRPLSASSNRLWSIVVFPVPASPWSPWTRSAEFSTSSITRCCDSFRKDRGLLPRSLCVHDRFDSIATIQDKADISAFSCDRLGCCEATARVLLHSIHRAKFARVSARNKLCLNVPICRLAYAAAKSIPKNRVHPPRPRARRCCRERYGTVVDGQCRIESCLVNRKKTLFRCNIFSGNRVEVLNHQPDRLAAQLINNVPLVGEMLIDHGRIVIEMGPE